MEVIGGGFILFLIGAPLYLKFGGGQDKLIYNPRQNAIEVKDPTMQRISTYTQDGKKLGGFLIHPENRGAMTENTIVYLHGIKFNPATKLPRLKEFAEVMNCQIVMFNYRGYAYSESAPCSEAKLQIDAQAILDWLVENDMVLGANIFLMGKSFGGAVASYLITQLSSKEGVPANIFFKGLILESTFTSLPEVIREKAGSWIPKALISDNTWPTIDRLSPTAVKVKTLIIHGTNDTLVKVEHAHALRCKLPEAELVLIPGADHNQLWKHPSYYESIRKFLQ